MRDPAIIQDELDMWEDRRLWSSMYEKTALAAAPTSAVLSK